MEKPLVSFCLLVYNQEKYIKEALVGVLNQTYSPIEIIISDDCSTDNSLSIIENELKSYTGSHKIIFIKNEKNLGLVKHINKVLYEVSKGDYIALAAGDDISHPDRISESIEFLIKNPLVCSLSSSLNLIDENSKPIERKRFEIDKNITFDINYFLSDNYKHINGSSRILSRKLINAFPQLNEDCHTEDTTFLFRAFLFGKVGLLSNKLVDYRLHDTNMSSAEGLKKMNVNNIFNQYYNDLAYSVGKHIDKSTYKKLIIKLNENKLKRSGKKSRKEKLSVLLRKVFKKVKSFNSTDVFWWSKRESGNSEFENFGDFLVPFLLEKITDKKFNRVEPNENYKYLFLKKKHYFVIGSLLSWVTKHSIVWGVGLMKSDQFVEKAEFLLVRGPLSRKRLMALGYEVPERYGDPAVLLALFPQKVKEKKYRLGIIPHYVDYQEALEKYKNEKDVLVIDLLTNNPQDVIDEILECEHVLSSSLHGVIVSHAIKVPVIWTKISDKVIGDVKFEDYYQSLEIFNVEPIEFKFYSNQETLDMFYPLNSIATPSKEKIDRLIVDLLETMPFKKSKSFDQLVNKYFS